MPEEDNKILKYNYGEKSTRVPFTIYADLESLLEKMNTCHNNPENSSTTKINKHTPSGQANFSGSGRGIPPVPPPPPTRGNPALNKKRRENA